ncbi:hypothetical protein Tco_0203910, partial [Tanacetum coccineum]
VLGRERNGVFVDKLDVD